MTAAVTDFSQFTALRRGAEAGDAGTLRAVAGQFEALFIETLLRNARETSFGDSPFESSFDSGERQEMYRGLLDRQLAVEMAGGRGIGLADMLVRQLGGDAPPAPGRAAPPAAGGIFRLPASGRAAPGAAAPAWQTPSEFVRDVWPHARRAARRLGVAPEAIVAQAALESGWGQRVMRGPDGASSLNLFGIKAGDGWRGSTVVRQTVEYTDGVAHREFAKFRSYPDLAAAFDDYAELLTGQARYRDVTNRGSDTTGFARALADAGYATDPAYAEKITRVLGSDTLREALAPLKRTANLSIAAGVPPGR